MSTTIFASTSHILTKPRMLHLLDAMENAPGPAVTLYFLPGTANTEIRQSVAGVVTQEEAAGEIEKAAAKSPAGAVLFWGEKRKYLVIPPFPLAGKLSAEGYQAGPLRSMLGQKLTLAIILVRLGAYGIGVFHDERLLSSKVGTGLVHARHRQGGSSSHRFERHREKQMEYFFTRVCGHVREHVEPHLKEIDWVVFGGEKNTIREFRNQCDFLKQTESRTLDVLLNVREPKQQALLDAIGQAWSSRVIEWKEM